MANISLTLPTIGAPNTTEDVKVRNALAAIQADYNGGINDTNIAAGGLTEAKMATGINGLAKGAFSVYRNVTPATASAFTVIVFDTEEFDVSNWYDITNGRYTPQVAGYYRLSASALFNPIAAAIQSLALFKNGVQLKLLDTNAFVNGTAQAIFNGTANAVANGTTDFFDIRFAGSNANAPLGGALNTYFNGELIGRS
jgi:hypothetical protein